jgi:hypothetical protein
MPLTYAIPSTEIQAGDVVTYCHPAELDKLQSIRTTSGAVVTDGVVTVQCGGRNLLLDTFMIVMVSR